MNFTLANLLCGLICVAQSGGSDVNVGLALDEPLTLFLKDAPLVEACEQMSQSSRADVLIGPEALGLLPYKDATRVNLRFERTPLREGLRALCDQIGMEYIATDRGIEIVPSPPLLRLGRQASWEELALLSRLMQMHWRGNDDDEFDKVRKLVRFDGLSGDPEDVRKQLARNVENAGAGSAAEVLSRATAAMGCTWMPWADQIVVMTNPRYVQYQMQRVVSLQFPSAPLADVLLELSRQAGVPIRMDAASAAALPERIKESVSLIAEGVTVEEALEKLVVAAGLKYEITDDGIVLSRPPGAPTATDGDGGSSRRRDPIVGKVIVTSPDGKHTYEWFIRESDLTPDEREQLEIIKRDGIEALKRDLPQ